MAKGKVFITGATGFLGSYIARLLVQNGYKVYALARPTSDKSLVKEIESKINWVEGDLSDILTLDDAISKVDFVFHCAAMVSFEKKDKRQMQEVNMTGTANIVNVCLAQKTKKLIHISSIASLGRGKDGDHIDEKSKWEESGLNSQYGITKYESEMEVWRGIAEGLNAVILNPSVILGMGFPYKGTMPFFDKFKKGFPFYSSGTTGFVDVRDVAQIALKALESDKHSERYIVNGENISYRGLFDMGATAFGSKKPSIRVNKFLEAISWRLAGILSFVTRKPPFLTKETANHSSKSYYYQNDKSKAAFDFEYRPIQVTIDETAQFYEYFLKTGNVRGLI